MKMMERRQYQILIALALIALTAHTVFTALTVEEVVAEARMLLPFPSINVAPLFTGFI